MEMTALLGQNGGSISRTRVRSRLRISSNDAAQTSRRQLKRWVRRSKTYGPPDEEGLGGFWNEHPSLRVGFARSHRPRTAGGRSRGAPDEGTKPRGQRYRQGARHRSGG